ncbi:MAG: alkaline phosphatase family protein [Verrucomicrobia bacterium]|nr:alkaline phosphatase family protein [Verrucomicrobiota bacterium]
MISRRRTRFSAVALELALLRRFALCMVALLAFRLASQAASHGKAEHVVVMVWDGMRPDFITPQYCPNLYTLATNGVFFKNHHPAYVSSTEVNGTAIATGAFPDHNGIGANTDYRPMLGWSGPNATEGVEAVRKWDLITGGKYLLVPTIAEILQAAGHPTITAGTKAVVFLHDRSNKRSTAASSNSVLLYKGQTIPRGLLPSLVKANEDKAFPEFKYPNKDADFWTTRSVRSLWNKSVPKYTLVWMSEPDYSQHEHSPGSENALAGIENNDKNLGDLLKALDEKKIRDKTDVFVVSDHGFSTVAKGPDVSDFLKKVHLKAGKKLDDPESGDVMVVPLGGSVALYVIDDDESVMAKIAQAFQTSDFAGPIFSRIPLPGTFPLSDVRIAITNIAPDLVLSMRWTEERNQYGVPGMLYSEGGTKNKGHHASLSRFDMHNTLVASGPDFKKGLVNSMPSGNTDLAPTILHILGVPQASGFPMDGRVLKEALVDGEQTATEPKTETREARRELGIFRWRQYLKYTDYDGVRYFDEGNAGTELR